MKLKIILLILLSLSSVFIVACATQVPSSDVLVQEEVVQEQELTDDDFSLVIDEELVLDDDFIEIGEMI